jgi:hypothetical protein
VLSSVLTIPRKMIPGQPGNSALPGKAGRRSAVRRLSLWVVFWLAAIILCACTAKDMGFPRLVGSPPGGLKVFGSFWASGWAASHGFNPYAKYPLTYITDPYPHYGRITDLNLNPPAILPLFQIFACFPANFGARCWMLISTLALVGGAFFLVRENQRELQHRQVLWLLLSWSVFTNLWIGQIYTLLFLLAVAAWMLLERNNQVLGGLFLGLLIAAKPNYALWAVLLPFCRRKAAAAVAAAVVLLLDLLPVVFYGPRVYSEWLRAVASDPHWMFPFEVSITGVASRLGHRLVGEVLAVGLLVFCFLLVAWKRPSLRNTSGIALSVAMLSSPLAWVHYSLVLAGPLLQKRWNWFMSIALLSLLPPFVGVSYFLPIFCVAVYFLWSAGWESGDGVPDGPLSARATTLLST